MKHEDKEKLEKVLNQLYTVQYPSKVLFLVAWGTELDNRWTFENGHDAVDFVEQCALVGLSARLHCIVQTIYSNEPWHGKKKNNTNTNL